MGPIFISLNFYPDLSLLIWLVPTTQALPSSSLGVGLEYWEQEEVAKQDPERLLEILQLSVHPLSLVSDRTTNKEMP